jgi:hypothetical protein
MSTPTEAEALAAKAKYVTRVEKALANEKSLQTETRVLLARIKDAETKKSHLKEIKKSKGYLSEAQHYTVQEYLKGRPLPVIVTFSETGQPEDMNLVKKLEKFGKSNGRAARGGRGGGRGRI